MPLGNSQTSFQGNISSLTAGTHVDRGPRTTRRRQPERPRPRRAGSAVGEHVLAVLAFRPSPDGLRDGSPTQTPPSAALGPRRRASPGKRRDARRVPGSTADCSAWLGDDAVAPAAQRGEHAPAGPPTRPYCQGLRRGAVAPAGLTIRKTSEGRRWVPRRRSRLARGWDRASDAHRLSHLASKDALAVFSATGYGAHDLRQCRSHSIRKALGLVDGSGPLRCRGPEVTFKTTWRG
jgi:hypothetical protein